MTVSILSYASAARYQPKRRLSSFCLVASRRLSYVVAAMVSSTAAALQHKELNQQSAKLGTSDVKDFFLAKAIGDKSDRLSDAAAELNEAPAEKCQTFQQEYSGTGKNTKKNKAKNFFASF